MYIFGFLRASAPFSNISFSSFSALYQAHFQHNFQPTTEIRGRRPAFIELTHNIRTNIVLAIKMTVR